jgi:hypothetical protein
MNIRTSTVLILGAIATFIAAWFPPAHFLDFTADDMHKAFIGLSFLNASLAIYLRTATND